MSIRNLVALSDMSFAAQPFGDYYVDRNPSKPRGQLIITLMIFFGAITGILFSLFLAFYKIMVKE